MARKKKTSPGQLGLLEARVTTAPCVPAIREAVSKWRDAGFPDITDTTRALLNYWFRSDHRLPSGRRFAYYVSQREAIETIIYLYEVVGIRRQKELLEQFAPASRDLRLLQYDDFPRYCVKMATGSGKTKVMSLAIVWQYLNSVVEARPEFARTFLVIAPNVIVFERLRTDFAGGHIFKTDPVFPLEFKMFRDELDCYMRGDPERASSVGGLYVTNIHQFYERAERNEEEPEIMTEMLGPKPPTEKTEIEDFTPRIARRGGPLLLLNDEAHHTHDEESEWNQIIHQLHGGVSQGLSAQLDFTATPRHSKGALFAWTVFDYPLKQAIIDGIVKRPMKGIASGIQEAKSQVASTRYRTYLTAGVERWREYGEQLAPFGKKPIFFVMMNDTNEANDVGDYLRMKYPSEFGGEKLLIIHTDKKGDVSKKDLGKARIAAREVDQPMSSINAIVSVLMLREGWDVQNVTVIVGLRPYTSKANILPEQTIGRGLRLMFRDSAAGYTERVDVIGNRAFIAFVEQLEKDEEVQFETFDLTKDKLHIITIAAELSKMDKDITIPVLSPILTRKTTLAEEIAGLDVAAMVCPALPRKEGDAAAQTFRYEGYDIITLQKIIEREYKLPEIQTSQEVISYYAKRIAQEVKLPSQFAVLVPKVREFLQTRAFGEQVNLDVPAMIQAISTNVAQYVTVKTFVEALRPLVVQQLEPQLVHAGRKLSETPPFPYSRDVLETDKTVFNFVTCDNLFELEFARFLKDAEDVTAFAKLPEQFGFAIEYTDAAGNLRYYEPDFVCVTQNNTYYIVETKGREDVDVASKDRAAMLWCENATRLTPQRWQYLKVLQTEFNKLQPSLFQDLLVMTPK